MPDQATEKAHDDEIYLCVRGEKLKFTDEWVLWRHFEDDGKGGCRLVSEELRIKTVHTSECSSGD